MIIINLDILIYKQIVRYKNVVECNKQQEETSNVEVTKFPKSNNKVNKITYINREIKENKS